MIHDVGSAYKSLGAALRGSNKLDRISWVHTASTSPMTPVPQSSVLLRPRALINSDTQTNQPFYQNAYFIVAAVAVILLIPLLMCRVCALRRSRRPLSNFFVIRRGPRSWLGRPDTAGTSHEPHRTMPLSPIGMTHRPSDRPAVTGGNGRNSFYAPGEYRKEALPVYDSVGAPPRYAEPERPPYGSSPAGQPLSGDLRAPPPTYPGLRNS